jgi:hypothetical protein
MDADSQSGTGVFLIALEARRTTREVSRNHD